MTGQDHSEDAASQTRPVLNGHSTKPRRTDLPPRSLQDICLEVRERVDAFLVEEPATPLLKSVQSQLRVSIAVVEEAMRRYLCVLYYLDVQHVADTFCAQGLNKSRSRIMGEKTVCKSEALQW